MGDPCERCGMSARRHRDRARAPRSDYWRTREQTHPHGACQDRIVGVDGEGQGDHPHLYTYLAGVDEAGRSWDVANPAGLTTEQCLDFFLALPKRALVVGFAFMYDLTMMLRDMPDGKLYALFHEERRQRIRNDRVVYQPVEWVGPTTGRIYSLNFVNRRFTVAQLVRNAEGRTRRVAHCTVWDIFRFFRSKFTTALMDWKIADKERLKWMESMKEKRGSFDKLQADEVQRYCRDECHYLSQLCRAVIQAHRDAGLELRHYYGAGSTASAFLEKIDVKQHKADTPDSMLSAVAGAFFGGRFENSVVGTIPGRVWNYDISSAYPYHATFLPCLVHGTWSHCVRPTISDIEKSRLACVHWSIPAEFITQHQRVWGPFPMRARTGTIAFPLSGDGGWVWKDEFIQGRRLSGAQADEAWLYHTSCDCRPFMDIPHYYKERVKLGKDAKGIPIKLGINSIYGKLAQSKGLRPPYQSWIWAGNITSGCRAQLLEAIANVGSTGGWDLLMFATDGIWSRVPIDFAPPRDTGTTATGKPLGGWETKVFDAGVFCVRPGIYFPLNPTDGQMEQVRARGLGKKVIYEQWSNIVRAWEEGAEKLTINGIVRFAGAKSSMSWGPKSGVTRADTYGEWVPHDISVSFNPMPKRSGIAEDGQRLSAWDNFAWESVPYKSAMKNPEMIAMQIAEAIAEEQPNLDFGDIE